MQQIGVDTAGGTQERREQRGEEQREPRSPVEVPEHAVAVGNSEVAELLGPDHLDLEAASAHVLDRIRDKPTRGITRRARIRRGQHSDAHYGAAYSSVTLRPSPRASASSSRPTARVRMPWR